MIGGDFSPSLSTPHARRGFLHHTSVARPMRFHMVATPDVPASAWWKPHTARAEVVWHAMAQKRDVAPHLCLCWHREACSSDRSERSGAVADDMQPSVVRCAMQTEYRVQVLDTNPKGLSSSIKKDQNHDDVTRCRFRKSFPKGLQLFRSNTIPTDKYATYLGCLCKPNRE